MLFWCIIESPLFLSTLSLLAGNKFKGLNHVVDRHLLVVLLLSSWVIKGLLLFSILLLFWQILLYTRTLPLNC